MLVLSGVRAVWVDQSLKLAKNISDGLHSVAAVLLRMLKIFFFQVFGRGHTALALVGVTCVEVRIEIK